MFISNYFFIQLMEAKSSPNKEAPTGIKVLSVLYYISAVFLILAGLFFLIMGILTLTSSGNNLGSQAEAVASLLFSSMGIFTLILGIVFIGLAVLNFFIARGLKKGKRWSRTLVIIFSCLGIILAVPSIIKGSFFSGIFDLLISGIIGGYLLFSSKVKEFFR